MKKILNIPYYSQHRDVKDEYWKSRACGILCLKMILDFIEKKKLQEVPVTFNDFDESSVDGFVRLANEKGAYGKSGWIHQGLIDIAKDFKIDLERKEFKSDDESKSQGLFKQGIKEIIFSLKNNKPVLVSAIKKWSEKKKFHMVVLTGFSMNERGELKGFYYNDTDYNNEQEGKNLFIDIKTFKKFWRRLAIFVE